MNERECSHCQKIYHLTEEFFPRSTPHTFRNKCKPCVRIDAVEYARRRRLRQPELAREQMRRYCELHADQLAAKRRQKYLANKEAILKDRAEYREKNREKIRAWHRQYYKDNREKRLNKESISRQRRVDKIRQAQRSYRNAHRLRNRLREKKLRYSVADFSKRDWEHCLAYWDGRCVICGYKGGDQRIICMEHWVPLAKGGLTDRANILPMCHGLNGCNNSKHASEPTLWLRRKLPDNAEAILGRIARYFAGS
jgi:hypothetical protein